MRPWTRRSSPCGRVVGARSPNRCCGRTRCTSPSPTHWACSMDAETAALRHRPLGAGHPYRIDPDQRHPVVPVVGERLELRVLATVAVDAVWVELELSGVELPLAAVDVDELYPSAESAEGHLAAASG